MPYVRYPTAGTDQLLRHPFRMAIPIFVGNKTQHILRGEDHLTNTAKHARATTVDIELNPVDVAMRLTIRDNGRGFDPQDPNTSDPRQHLGLLSMQERIEVFNGQFSLLSTPGKGTTITVEVPL